MVLDVRYALNIWSGRIYIHEIFSVEYRAFLESCGLLIGSLLCSGEMVCVQQWTGGLLRCNWKAWNLIIPLVLYQP